MNNKGFTLIELIATIALIAIISVISFVSINAVIDKSRVSDCENLVKSIKSASKEYISDNRYGTGMTIIHVPEKHVKITAKTLVNGKYLTSSITNPFDNTLIKPEDISITIYLADDYSVNVNKDIIIKNASGTEVVCENNKW